LSGENRSDPFIEDFARQLTAITHGLDAPILKDAVRVARGAAVMPAAVGLLAGKAKMPHPAAQSRGLRTG
jgi:hypothetical protein